MVGKGPEPNDHQLEKELVSRLRAGDEQAFDQIVSAYTPPLYRVVRRIASDQDEAEAILQETFLRFWKALPWYDEERPLLPYLVTIAVNRGRDVWRRSRLVDFTGLGSAAEDIPGFEPTPESQVEQAEQLQALAEAVARLPLAYRAVIALRYDAGLSYQEIAESLDLPVNTVRTHLRRAKAHLRTQLERTEE